MQRRHLLAMGWAAATVTVLGGAAWRAWRPAVDHASLSPPGRELVAALAAAILEGLLPTPADERAAAMTRYLARVDDVLSGLPPHLKAELAQLLTVLAFAPGRMMLAGLAKPWGEAETAEVRAALQGMRSSRLALRQQAYHALRDLTNAAWFAAPEAWEAIGYPGPLPLGLNAS